MTYADAQRGQVKFTIVDDLLAGLTMGGNRMSLRVERAS